MTRLALLLSATLAFAHDGTETKPKAEDYPAHIAVGKFTMAAEYLVRSIPTQYGMFDAGDYLVIDVALFGPKDEHLQIADGQFNLRLNGKKEMIAPESPQFVAAAKTNPGWESRPRLEASGGNGAGQIGIDTANSAPRFPGDPTGNPNPPTRNPEPPDPNTTEKRPDTQEQHPPLATMIQSAALPEGDRVLPVSGLLFFHYKGKTKDIKFLELIYVGPAGKVTLKIQ